MLNGVMEAVKNANPSKIQRKIVLIQGEKGCVLGWAWRRRAGLRSADSHFLFFRRSLLASQWYKVNK